jgi:lipopolysaccharide transport system ATP-binding protein
MLEVGTGFHSELTGRENIYMNGAILGMTKAEIDSKIEDIIDFSEVRDFIDTPVKRYSSGMYVKLAFSVAAHLDSEIMIMDEVLAVGDVAFQAKCLNKMRDAAKKEGRTVLYVSHNMNTIRQLCDRCIVLEGGKKTYDGDVEEAIRIYLGNKMDYKNIVDLEKREREANIKNRPVTMLSLEALNSKTSIYNVGDVINMSLKCYSTRTIDNAFLMVIIKNLEGTPITMMTVNNGFKLNKDKETQISFDIDISHLVPERYSISMVIYEVNDYGGSINLDVLREAYLFEIVQTKNFNNNMAWIPRNWGYFYNAPLVLKNQGYR